MCLTLSFCVKILVKKESVSIMLRIMNYATPESLDEAYALLTKNKKNMILGGMIWLKMEDIQIKSWQEYK